MGLGVIILDDVYPGFPGDVRNASAYPFPIQYDVAEGVDIHCLVVEEDKSPCLEPLLASARRLERMGCRAIAARVRVLRLLPARGRGRGPRARLHVLAAAGALRPAAHRPGPGRRHPDGERELPDRAASDRRGIAAGLELRGRRRDVALRVRGVRPPLDGRAAHRSAERRLSKRPSASLWRSPRRSSANTRKWARWC